ncbi:amidase [Aureimonas populi]|uniref:Amidase n=1 Tax=Aureimonas populi TaxID=1701758 RepID=A0ABW5CKY1_9HYPH|nr:amidase [Aureimonas populi]
MTDDLLSLSAPRLVERFAARTLSPSEYWQALEGHIARWEPAIAALYAYDPDAARAEAAASTERWARGRPLGPLDGVPASVKEVIATRGVPVPLGTAASMLEPAAADAPPAARLREAGAIIFAKTTCPDYGMLSSGLSTFHPLTRNPWDTAMNPGGSSAGAAAAAAAGYGPLHLGTDIGGSVRLPAGWCGVFGFKPTQGRIPVDPFYVGRCAGPMTRTVADSALMMPLLSRPDARDATSLPFAEIDWQAPLGDIAGLRIGLMTEAGCGIEPEDAVLGVLHEVARRLEARGARIVPLAPVLTREMLDGLDDFWRARFWNDLMALPEPRRARVLPAILDWVARAGQMTGPRAALGFNRTLEMASACANAFEAVDFVLSPTNPVVSYPAEWPSPTNDPADKPFEHIGFTVPWNMGGQPAASVNGGFSPDGFPIGVQIVAPRFADTRVLALSRLVEEMAGPIPWPEPPAPSA